VGVTVSPFSTKMKLPFRDFTDTIVSVFGETRGFRVIHRFAHGPD
jgi:hypothetical protein